MRNCKSILLTVISLVIISCEEKMPELSLGVPTMGEVEVTDNGSLVFEVQGSLTSYENLVSECGFCIGTDASMEGAARYPCKLTGKTFSTSITLEGYNRKYYVCSYITNGRAELLSEKKTINIGPLSSYMTFGIPRFLSIDDAGTAHFEIPLTVADGVHLTSLSISYGKTPEYSSDWTETAIPYVKGENVSFGFPNTSEDDVIYYRLSFSDGAISDCSIVFLAKKNILSNSGSANCYIVSEPGVYKFKTVKGNSNTSMGSISSCEVLWESFGTDKAPNVGDLVREVTLDDGFIVFQVPAPYHKGNAVIAARNPNGQILWSWHIWLTDEPAAQEYFNNAGVMMDRNLGATSATPGKVEALGLLYQWGRKDPFLGSASISDNYEAKSTILWPVPVESSYYTGTIAFATANPTTFICGTVQTKNDWCYTSIDEIRWKSDKTIYDPCPAGWRVPDGGGSGVWSNAFGTSREWYTPSNWDFANKGMDFSRTDKKLGASKSIWYPASGGRDYSSGSLYDAGGSGYFWSAAPDGLAYYLYFNYGGCVTPVDNFNQTYGRSVRCLQE